MENRKNLQRARIARGMDLSRVSAVTALSPAIVRKIDDGRFEELPGGLYARSYVRAFADAVGIPAEQALAEVEELLPGVPDPLPTLREKAGHDVLAQVWAYLSRLGGAATSADEPETVADATSERSDGPWLILRGAAAAIDAAILIGIGGIITMLTAWVCGVGVIALLEQAGLALAAMLILPVLIYFGVFQGIGGRTPGARACGLPRSETARDSRLLMIAARALRKA